MCCFFCKLVVQPDFREFIIRPQEFDDDIHHLACPPCFAKLLKGEFSTVRE